MLTKNQIKLIRSLRIKKNRNKHGLFVAEGEKIVDELLDSNLKLYHLFTTEDKYELSENYTVLKSHELEKISILKTPNKVLAVFEIPELMEIDFNKNIIALEEINDPGNLGTIIRLCDWYGIKDIICSKKSVDCFNPKTIQSSMGSISRVNISYIDFDSFSKEKHNMVASDLNGEKLKDFVFTTNHIIFFGSESNGFSEKLSSKIDDKITIERFNNNVESLNLATSVGIVLSELKSQITGK